MKKFRFEGIDESLIRGIDEVKGNLGISVCEKGTVVEIRKEGNGISIVPNDDKIVLTYGKTNEFYRALSQLCTVAESGKAVKEETFTKDLCFMADVSRDAVLNMESAKRLIRYLALMGYSSMMLYTEDTFEVKEYPYFGYMRGRYSKDELKEIDDYAFGFGIEVIPCIQTLAHLSCALRWNELYEFADTSDIMLVGEEKTYKFIDAMLKTCKECFRSKNINIGMDEAASLGYGTYIRRNGYRNQHEIMLEHLNKVTEMCHENGYHPMIWSDMFFRMVSPTGSYRSDTVEISEDVIKKVPKDLTVIYWDYYKSTEAFFTHMVNCHLKFVNNDVAFAGGAWKWSGFTPNNKYSIKFTEMQMKVCREKGINNIIVTCWGDNGAEAAQFSAIGAMLYFAESAYEVSPDNKKLNERAMQCLGISYDALLSIDDANRMPNIDMSDFRINPTKYLLYNDPMGGLFDCHLVPGETGKAFAENAKALAKNADNKDFGYIFDTQAKLCSLLEIKAELSYNLRQAYKANDKKALADYADNVIPQCIDRLNTFIDAFRSQWYHENKTFLFSNHEVRLGGLKERLISVQQRLNAYVNGEVDKIEELEQKLLPFCDTEEGCAPYITYNNWKDTCTVGVM